MNWKIQELSNKRWKVIFEGTETEVRAEFYRTILNKGSRRLVDENGREIAKVKWLKMATYLHYCNLIATYTTAFIGVVSLFIIAGYLTIAAIDQWMFLFKLMPLFAEFLT